MIRPSKNYTIKEKRKIAQLVISGKESVLSASHRFGIGGSMTIYRWIKQYQDGKLQQQSSTIMAKDQKNPSNSITVSDNAAMQDELEMLRLKVLAYETMIDIAEKELGISIKKKSSAKQSPASEQNEETCQ
jgi:transposase-like protein